MKNNQLPEVRFPEFKDAWELRKAKAIFKSIVEKGKENLPVLSVTQKNGVVYREDVGIDIKYDPKTLNGYKVIHPNNFVISLRSFQGGFELSDKLGITSPAYTIFEPVDKNLNDNLFWKSKFKTFDFIESLKTVTFGIRDGKSISFTEFGDLKIIFPSKEEQEKIGIFFKSLDDTIALYQHKLNILKQTKRGLLQKMFPKEGEKVPEVRFPEFSDDWELRKLDETFDFPVSTNSLSRSQLNYDKGEIKSIHYGDILVNYDSILEIAKDRIPFITDGVLDKYKPNLLENGDLIFADAAEDETVGKAVEVAGKTNECIVAGLHTIVARPKEKMAKFFWGYYINSDIYHSQLLRLMQGTKVASISKTNLKKTNVSYPKSFVEQQKIGAFFKTLDNTIALHQRELEILKNTKKAFLQKMFV